MATYIPGLTDYIPQIQEFKPDYNFYNKALQMRQSKYDAAHEQLSTLYGSLLNSPMLREKNVAERDQFFKVIDQDIKKMASLDLSKQQNVQAASTVFNQLLDNKNIVKDMTWTRNWQKQHQKADAMRNCIDPEKCGGSWWQGGVDYLNYQAEDFKNASESEAMNFANARYVASQNITDMAMKIAKDANFNIKIDQRTGGFIVTTKNGPNAVKPLYSLLAGKIGNDPKVLDYLQAKNFVDRKNWIRSNVETYGSEEAATSEYVKQRSMELKSVLEKQGIEIEATNNNIKQEADLLEEKVSTGTVAASKKDLMDVFNEVLGAQNSIEETSTFVKEASNNYKQAEANNFSKATLRSLDRAGVIFDLQNGLMGAAQTLAYKDFEQTMQVDPYAMESVKQANRKALEIDKYYLQVGLEREKFKLDMLEKQYEAKGGLLENQAISITPTGGVSVNLDDAAGWEFIAKQTDETDKALSGAEMQLTNSVFNAMVKQSKNKGGVANEDLVQFMDAVVSAYGNSSNYKSSMASLPERLKEQIKGYKNLSPDQKAAFARNFDPEALKYLRGSVIDDIYDNNVAPLLDMSKKNNAVLRDYLKPITTSAQAQAALNNIYFKNQYLNKLNDVNKQVARDVKDKIISSNAYPDFDMYIDLFIDELGIPLSKEEFSRAYMKNALSQNPNLSKQQLSQLFLDGGEIYDDNIEDVETTYKALYNESIESPAGVLKGYGSFEIDAADLFPVVDASKHLATTTQDVNSHINAYRKANSQDYIVSAGGFSDELPDATDEDAKAILDFLITDWQRRTDSKDKSRPILTTTYQDIAGSNKDWTGLNIKVNPQWIDQYKGSEKLEGLTRDMYTALTTDGITLYGKKDKLQSALTQKAAKTDIEKILDISEQFDISNGQYNKDLKITRDNQGGYKAVGQMAVANKETGNLEWQDITDYGNDPNLLYQKLMTQYIAVLQQSNDKILKDYLVRKGLNPE